MMKKIKIEKYAEKSYAGVLEKKDTGLDKKIAIPMIIMHKGEISEAEIKLLKDKTIEAYEWLKNQ